MICFIKKRQSAIKVSVILILLFLTCFFALTNLSVSVNAQDSNDYVVYDGVITKYNGSDENLTIPSIYNGETIVAIGDNAFAENASIVNVYLPDTVTTVGNEAFRDCKNLKSIRLSENLTNIGKYAFSRCVSLKEITIPGKIKTLGGVGGYVFNECSSLARVTVEEGVEVIGEFTFYKCSSLESIDLPESVNILDTWAFGHCTSLVNIDLPDNLKTVGSATFYGCTELLSINIPDSVTQIGTHSFRACEKLAYVKLPSQLKSIPFRAFSGCVSLHELSFPAPLESIGDEAFYESGLQSVKLNDALISIGNMAFYSCAELKNVSLSSKVEAIGNSAFANCSALASVELSDALSAIGEETFLGCISLKEIVIPNSVKSIGDSAFSGCSNILTLTLGSSLESIGALSFEKCYRLVEIYNLSDLELTLGSSENGGVALFAQSIHTDATAISHIWEDEQGFAFYKNPEKTSLLLGYYGDEIRVKLPDSCDGIEYDIARYAFFENDEISRITIPKCVKSIGDNAFNECASLRILRYAGTATAWREILVGEGNDPLSFVLFDELDESELEEKAPFSFFGEIRTILLDLITNNVFLLNFILTVIWGFFLIYNGQINSDRNKKTFIFIICIQWILISGLRADSVGADTENYMRFFDVHSKLSWKEIFTGIVSYIKSGEMGSQWYMDMEPLFILFNKVVSVFTTSHVAYKFIVAIAFMSSFGIFLYKYSKDPCLSFVLYGSLFFNMFSLTGYRQVLSVAIILFAFKYIRERKLLPFLVFLLVAFFFHKTTLVFLLLYILANKKISSLYILTTISTFLGILIFRSQIFNLIKEAMGYEEYGGNYGFRQLTFVLLLSIITIVAIWRYKYVIKDDPDALWLYNGLILSWMMVPLIIESPTCMRLVYDFGFTWLLLVPAFARSFNEKIDRIVCYTSIFLVFMMNVATSEFVYTLFWM